MTDRRLRPVEGPRLAQERLEAALFEIKRVIAGQDPMLERVLVCLLAGGHLLIEGVPGLAKTLTIKTTAPAARRLVPPDPVHARPRPVRPRRHADLPPKDATFDVELGPVFCNFLLADEINRAPAKVQSALLEVMQERQVTIGGATHPGPRPVPRPRDAEPDRVRGHLPAARGAARPLPAQGARRLPGPGEELTVVERSLAAAARRSSPCSGSTSCGGSRRRPARSTSTRSSSAMRCRWRPRRGASATTGTATSPSTSPSAPPPAARSPSSTRRARSR